MENVRARVGEFTLGIHKHFFSFFWLKQTKRFLFSPIVAINGFINWLFGCNSQK